MFGLQEAPVFYPTWEEFQNPMQYVEWVASPKGGNGAAFGIAKIVPPEGWAPEFVVDQDTFRFRTRVQRLSEVSAEGRVGQNYEEQLVRFHAQQGCGRVAIPLIGGNRINVYALKKAAKHHGATDWQQVSQALGLDGEGTADALKQVYEEVIVPFEEFLARTSMQRRTNTSDSGPSAAAICSVCSRGGDGDKMLLCDECNIGMHMYCLDPCLLYTSDAADE